MTLPPNEGRSLSSSPEGAVDSGDHHLEAVPTVIPRTDANVMDPDDPILARTQAVLKKQLVECKIRLEGEVREKSKLLSDAKKKREDTGVHLFNFQQQLARLQMDLEKAHDNHMNIAAATEQAEGRVHKLREDHERDLNLVKDERIRTDKFQEELDRYAR
jgi:coiled-coil domain-containing protein 40